MGSPASNRTYTEYVSFGGQTIAEKDQTGAWTDYIFAGGKKLAMLPGQDRRIHTHGTFTSSNNELRWNLPNPTSSTGSAYTIKQGDTICWRQYNAGGAVGGPAFWLSNQQGGYLSGFANTMKKLFGS